MTIEQFLEDTIELTRYLRNEFQQDKNICNWALMGNHSRFTRHKQAS